MQWNEKTGQRTRKRKKEQEACVWGGSALGGLGGCRAISDVKMEDSMENIEMVVDS